MLVLTLGCDKSVSVRKNDLQKMKLSGKIKKIQTSNFTVINSFGKIKKGKIDPIRSLSNSIHVFNKEGLIENKKYALDDNGNFMFEEKYIYDLNGYLMEIQSFDSYEELNYKYLITYGTNGNILEGNRYYSWGELESKKIFIYDKNGNETECTIFDSSGNMRSKFNYKYDVKGNQIEIRISLNGQDESKEYGTMEYDKYGNQIHDNTINSKGEKVNQSSFEYEFDNMNNWIKCVRSKNGIPRSIEERTIEYYN